MTNPNPVVNMEIGKALKTSAKTPVGKFYRNFSNFKRENIPDELIELYDFCKGLDTKKVDYLTELKNLYFVIQKAMMPGLLDKMLHGEMLNKKELDALKLIKDTLVESHKLKFGDHKVIEKVVTYDDIRKAIYSDKKIINAKVINNEPVSQDMDRSGCGEESRENRETNRDNQQFEKD